LSRRLLVQILMTLVTRMITPITAIRIAARGFVFPDDPPVEASGLAIIALFSASQPGWLMLHLRGWYEPPYRLLMSPVPLAGARVPWERAPGHGSA